MHSVHALCKLILMVSVTHHQHQKPKPPRDTMTTSPEHIGTFKDYNALTDLEKDIIEFSEAHKEAHNFRPTAGQYQEFKALSETDRQAWIHRLYDISNDDYFQMDDPDGILADMDNRFAAAAADQQAAIDASNWHYSP